MITTPSMGLKRWDQPNDVFSYTELSDNFALLDAHDHSTGKGVQVPTNGIANLAITGPKIANDAVDASKIAAGAVGDSELASPALGVWRTLSFASTGAQGGVVSGGSGSRYITGSGANIGSASSWPDTTVAANSAFGGPALVPIAAASLSVTGKTTQVRVVTLVTVGNTAPVSNITGQLFPFTLSGANQILTLGAGVAVALVPAPAATSKNIIEGTAVALPADGVYVFGFTNSASYAAGSTCGITVYLQVRHV